MKKISSICGISAAVALLLPAVSHAAWVIGPGTTILSSDRTETDYISIQGGGTLSHTAGTLTDNSTWGMIVGQGGTTTGMFAYYTMSGSATYIGQSDIVGNAYTPWSVTGTWSLTDNASASLSGTLSFGNGQTSGNQLRLAGDAAFTVGTLTGLDATDEYINFAPGSTATLTVSNLLLADYETLVTSGRIRINDIVQSDFSNFQVSNHTLSLAPAADNYATWAAAQTPPLLDGPDAVGPDGLTNLMIYALDLKVDGTNGSPGTLSGRKVTFVKRVEAVDHSDVTYMIEESADLAGSWTPVIPDEDTDSVISYTLPVGRDRIFTRLVVKLN